MALPAGNRVGPYEILAPIGAGGMGEVYRARDTRLDRDVAIKVLHADGAGNPASHDRLEREARAASALNHPNVAHVYEINEAEGVRFIAMEFVDGPRLDQEIAAGPLPADRIVEIGSAMADALDAAHAKGIVHRDIKPANVMFTARGQVKVLDFGLARIDRAAAPDVTVSSSQAGLILGTVQYMSPEQALGRAVDARTDLFSLGVVLYEMTTGRLPFTGLSTTETIERIAHAQPDAVSRFNYEAPAELERIIRKLLEKDAARRYQTARELLVDLRNLRRDSDEMLRSTPVPAAARRRGRTLAIVLPVAALAAGLAGWFAWGSAPQRPAVESLVVLPFANETGDPEIDYLAEGLSDTLIENLSRLPGLRIVPRGIAFRYRNQDPDPRDVAAELRVSAVLMGRVRQRGTDVTVQAELIDAATLSRLWGDRYERPMSGLVGLQADLTQAVAETISPGLGRPERTRISERQTTDSEAYQLYLKGRHHWNKRTEAGLRLALEHFRQAADRDPAFASAFAGQADAYSLLARYQFEAPSSSYPLARAAARRALELDDTTAEVHASLGYVAMNYDHDWDTASRAFQRSVELDPEYATARHWHGLMLAARGDLEAARRELGEAARLEPLSPIIAANLGRVAYYAGDMEPAIRELQKALELDANFGEGLLRLGWALDQMGRYDEAIAAYRRASDRAGTSVQGALGHAYAKSGRRGEASALLEDLRAQGTRRYVDAYDLALIHVGLGQLDEAVGALELAVTSKSGMVVYAMVDPKLEPLRRDPRFTAVLARMKLN
jgi:eukaryotic-like serine/threonine-protein kinase